MENIKTASIRELVQRIMKLDRMIHEFKLDKNLPVHAKYFNERNEIWEELAKFERK